MPEDSFSVEGQIFAKFMFCALAIISVVKFVKKNLDASAKITINIRKIWLPKLAVYDYPRHLNSVVLPYKHVMERYTHNGKQSRP